MQCLSPGKCTKIVRDFSSRSCTTSVETKLILNAVLILLLLSLLSSFQTSLAKDISKHELSKILNLALEKVKSGQSKVVYNELIKHEGQFAGNPQFDYILGLSALESGNTGYAVFALLRAISMDNRNIGAVLDLGRAYFHLGEYVESEKSFRKVLTFNPPDNVKTVAGYYLRSIIYKRIKSRASPWSNKINIGLSAGYDTNANSSPDIEHFLQTPLSEQSRALASKFVSADVSAIGRYKFDKSLSLNSRLRYLGRKYDQASFVNNDVFTGSIGLQKRVKRNIFLLNSHGMQSFVAGKKSGRNTGLMGQWQYALKKRLKSTVFTQYSILRNASGSEIRDTNQINAGLGITMVSAQRGAWQTNLSSTFGKATVTQKNSPYGNRNYGLIASAVKRLNQKYKANSVVSAAVINTRYEGKFASDTGTKLRRDLLTSLSWNNSLVISKVWKLGLNVAYTVNVSNVSLYDFSRTMTGMSVRRGF